MLGLPRESEINKRVSKESLYRNVETNSRIKQRIVDQIEQIWWRNKVTEETSNVAPGEKTTEIDVFEIRLKTPELDVEILKTIDKAVPRPTLYLLEFEGKYQAAIAYKEVVKRGEDFAVKISEFYKVGPLELDALPCKAEGLTLDSVYENFVRQIAGDKLPRRNDSTLKEDVERDKERTIIQKKIDAIEKKARRERQFNKQVEIRAQAKPLWERLRKITDERTP